MFSAVLAVALAAPAVSATWSAFGSFEPDNALDVETFMFFDPAPAGAKRVYFAAFATTGAVANVNVATLQTSMEQVTLEYHQALFGVWVDCNGDGYVGMAEGALYEYASELLLDDSVCPPSAGAGNAWTEGAHNYNGWVSEFIPIGGIDPDEADNNRDRRVYRDPEAMVWGDYGRPTDDADVGGSCALTPQPRGTFQSTGGLINYLGCPYPGLSGRWDEVILGRDVVGVYHYPGLDPSNSNDLAFHGDARESALEFETLGSEDSSGAPATVWDCRGDDAFHLGDTANQTPLGPTVPGGLQNTYIHGVSPAPGNTADPSAPGFVNHTVEGAHYLDDGAGSSDCDTSNDAGHDTYGMSCNFIGGSCLGESDFNGVSPERKTEADWNLQFDDSARGSPWGLIIGANGDAGTSNFAGITPAQNAAGAVLADQVSSMWFSPSQFVKRGPSTIIVNTYNGAIDIPPAYYLTFYAHAGSATASRGFQFPGGSAAYGAAQCGENTSGVRMGWECDPDAWYVNPDGSRIPEPYPYARPGQSYELRDVDCYDGGVGDTGIGASTPYYGAQACP